MCIEKGLVYEKGSSEQCQVCRPSRTLFWLASASTLLALLLYWDAVELHVCIMQRKNKSDKNMCAVSTSGLLPRHEVTMLTL